MNRVKSRVTHQRWRHFAIVVVALLFVLTACGGSSSSTESTTTSSGKPKSGGDLVVSQVASPTSLDPTSGGSGLDHSSLYPLYARLINFTPDLKPKPGLAKSWEYPNPLTLVLHLQPDVKFQDGTAMDAAAVKFNIERAKTLPTSSVKANLASISTVDATAPDTVTIHLSGPDTSLPLIFADRAGMMVSPTAVQSEGDGFASKPVGAGPFKFVSFAPGDSLVMTKNADYWEPGKPYVDSLTIKYIANGQTSNNALVDKQIDFAIGVSPELVGSLKSKSGMVVNNSPTVAMDSCYFNFTKAPFNNVKARQAISYAIDNESLNKAINFGQGGEAAEQLFPKNYWAYQKDIKYAYKHDSKKASQLWEEAGMKGVTINAIGYNAPGQSRKLQIIQSQLKQAGIDMTVDIKDVSAANQEFFVAFGPADLYCSGWSGRPDPNDTYSSLISPKGFNRTGTWAPPGTEELVAAGKQESDPADRAKAYKPLAKLVQDQMMFLPLDFKPLIVGYQSYVEGYVADLYGKPDVSFIWVDKQ